MKVRHLIVAALSFMALQSCGLYSKYEAATTVPNRLFGSKGDTLQNADSSSIGTVSWKDFFKDPQLQSIISSALKHNVDMRAAVIRVTEAQEMLKTAKLAYVPTLSFVPECGVTKLYGKDLNTTSKSFSVPLVASWEVEVFGKLTNAKRKQEAAFEQSEAFRQATQATIISNAAMLYYTLLMLDEKLEIAKATELAWSKTVETSKILKEGGKMNEAAVSQYTANYYRICTITAELERSVKKTENALCYLLNRTPGKIIRGSLNDQQQYFPENLSVGFPVSMLSNRPDVKMAEMALAQQFYSVNIARSAFYPSISLSGLLGWTNSGGNIPSPGAFIANALAQLTQPIFQRGQLKARLRVEKAELEIAQMSFERSLIKAGSEVNDALIDYQTAITKQNLLDSQVESLEKAVESTELLMKHGSTTYLEVLTSQQSLLDANLNNIENRFNIWQSVISLYQALGGGKE